MSAWVRVGLPRNRDKTFAPARVRAWLLKKGKAEPEERSDELILHTRQEVASYFGVNLRTVAQWLTEEGFPGRAGDPANHGQDGHFPVSTIAAWLRANKSAGDGNPLRNRLLEIQVEDAEFEHRKKRERWVEVDEVVRRVQQGVNAAVAVLEQLADRQLSRLPSDPKRKIKAGDLRKIVRATATEAVDEVRDLIADIKLFPENEK